MLKLRIQLLVEKILSGGKPYISSHPELGVPIGIFNTKDEPNYSSRKQSIQKLGKKGNSLSYRLALLFGITNPIPSFVTPFTPDQKDEIDKRIAEAVKEAKLSSDNTITGTGPSSDLMRVLHEMSQVRTPQVDLGVKEIQDMVQVMTDLKNGTIATEKAMEQLTKILALEDTIRLDISKTLGVSNAQQLVNIKNINAAAGAMTDYGIRATAVKETFMSITKAIGRNLNIPEEVLKRASLLTKTLTGFDPGKFAAGFDEAGMNLKDAFGAVNNTDSAMSEILQTGREFGVVMEAYVGSASDQLKLMNTYGFEDGVKGLSRMVARGQVLGLEMGKVTGLAEKFFDPEGAIDFAANMQVIGGAVGDLADPFKLMYMATNDLEGLQTAIQDTAAEAVHFDKEKGKFSISPDSRRQLKAMAEQMGMSYQELADTAIQSAKRAQVFDQFTADIPEADKELIASMAKIGTGGVAQVKIPSLDKMMDVEDLTPDMIKELSSANMTDTQFYDQQITVAEKTNQYLASMENLLREQVQELGGSTTDADMRTLSQMIADGIAPEKMAPTPEEMKILTDPTTNTADQKAILEKIYKRSLGEMPKILEQQFKNAGIINDFILRPGEPIQKFNEDDLIIGGTNLMGETKNITNRTSNIENMMSAGVNTGGGGKVLVTGTIKLEGGAGTTEVDINRFITRLSQNSGTVQALNKVIIDAAG